MARSTRVFRLNESVARGDVHRSATGFRFTRQAAMNAARVSIVNVLADQIKPGDMVFFSKSPTATAELIETVVIPLTRGKATKINGREFNSIARFDVIRADKLR